MRTRPPVAGEVLQGRNDAVVFQAADVRGAELGHQVGILAHGFLDPSPAVVADHVKHWRQTLMHADRGHISADGGGHLVDQIRVEGGGPGQRGRIDRCLIRRKPG